VCAVRATSVSAIEYGLGPLPGNDAPSNEVHANPDEVLIDLVVRDKKNKPVTNLSAADIKVSDAGNPVQLADLHLVTPGSGSTSTIALLFDHMSQSRPRLRGILR